jgi:hypothetical protein
MSTISDPKFDGIDVQHSYVLGVIYDDESLTLEMDFKLTEQHSQFASTEEGEDGRYRNGFVRFADIEDLNIAKARTDGDSDYSTIYSASGDGRNFEISCGWGEIKVAARIVRVQLD